MRATPPLRLARPLAAGLLFLLAGAIGCSGDAGRGSVAGKITIGGKPMPKGLITFLSEAGNRDAFSSAITDGKYEIPDMPAGMAKIYIIPPQDNTPPPVDKGDVNPVAKVGVKVRFDVPEKYQNAATSGLSLDVKKGPNEFSADLVP